MSKSSIYNWCNLNNNNKLTIKKKYIKTSKFTSSTGNLWKFFTLSVMVADSLEVLGSWGSDMEIHNQVGFRFKAVTLFKATLYSLMPAGSILKVPDSLWAHRRPVVRSRGGLRIVLCCVVG